MKLKNIYLLLVAAICGPYISTICSCAAAGIGRAYADQDYRYNTMRLLNAASLGDIATIKKLLTVQNFDVNRTDGLNTALSIATTHEQYETVKFLLSQPGIIVIPVYPLLASIKNKNVADILKIKTKELQAMMLESIKKGDTKQLKAMSKLIGLDMTDDEGNTPLQRAFICNNSTSALWILKHLVDPRESLATVNKKGQMALELVSPKSAVFYLCMNLAYGVVHKTSIKQKVKDLVNKVSQPALTPAISKERSVLNIKSCAYCSQNAISFCGKCRRVYYCSKECQKNDYAQHKKVCCKPKQKE